jgi:hypothetical protein
MAFKPGDSLVHEIQSQYNEIRKTAAKRQVFVDLPHRSSEQGELVTEGECWAPSSNRKYPLNSPSTHLPPEQGKYTEQARRDNTICGVETIDVAHTDTIHRGQESGEIKGGTQIRTGAKSIKNTP